MYTSTIALLLSASAGAVLAQGPTTGQLGNASVITNNPAGKSYVGTLPAEPFWKTGALDGNVKGSVTVKSSPGGTGVEYTVKFSNLPKEGGPFPFHIHAAAVPSNGNCTATLAHLDPFVRGEDPVCDSALPETCQVGDLSGKYGKITSDPYEFTFHDDFASLNIGSNASIQDRSFVVHFANKTRITCANFAASGYGNSTPAYPTTGGVYPTGTAVPTATPVPAGANVLNAGASLAAMAAAALFALI
ncbi:putative Superoxide dismutase [Seiridium unicorne]|uniref:Superoxide dismutase n=1 Tax=Seiridium unicorne TaxID=138068 RepID=A0ABR2UTS1_9PEZI